MDSLHFNEIFRHLESYTMQNTLQDIIYFEEDITHFHFSYFETNELEKLIAISFSPDNTLCEKVEITHYRILFCFVLTFYSTSQIYLNKEIYF